MQSEVSTGRNPKRSSESEPIIAESLLNQATAALKERW
jgi:hypothetical protein